MKRYLKVGVPAALALLLVIQLVPYGRDHKNPPVTHPAIFKSAAVRQIVADSCNDCHSNLTKWPWYTNVAPASWLVMNDVDGGRKVMNLSEWNKPQPQLNDLVDIIQSGEMPPLKYKIMPNHSKARLSDTQKKELIAGFRQLYATQPPTTHPRTDG
jgi:hypothetical protein